MVPIPDDVHQWPRVFLDTPAHASLPQSVDITHEPTVHHVRTVLRMKPGHGLVAVDGWAEQAYLARLEVVERQQLGLTLLTALPKPTETLPYLTVGAALIKNQRWDWMLQKLTELGTRCIIPVESQRAVVQIGSAANKQARWQQVVRNAAEQSEGLYIPTIAEPGNLTAFVAQTKGADVKVVLVERGENRLPMRLIYRKSVALKSMAVAIGPEGGWSDQEVQLLLANGFQAASFGQRILRSETAAIGVISALIYECGA